MKKPDSIGRVVVIGASAGGVEAVSSLAARFPPDLDAAVFVVLHIPHNATSYMPQILSRAGRLRAIHPTGSMPMERGVIYVAPPDKHLLVEGDHVTIVSGPRENGHRPAVDPLFRSAADSWRNRVIGVVLSGNLDDGTAGLAAIKACGGIALVQSPEETLFPGMPMSAIENVAVDHVLPLAEIVPTIVRLIDGGEPSEEPWMKDQNMELEVRNAQLDSSLADTDAHVGSPSGFSCPECSGVLWEVEDGKLVRYRCRVGHAYSAESLLSASSSAVEAALWASLRSLEENAAFARRLSRRATVMEQHEVSERFVAQADRASAHAVTIRNVLLSGPVAAQPRPERLIAPE